MAAPTIKLNNGLEIPVIGLGEQGVAETEVSIVADQRARFVLHRNMAVEAGGSHQRRRVRAQGGRIQAH